MKKQLIASAQAFGFLSLAILPTVVFAQDPISGGFNVAQNIGGGALGTADPRETIVSLVNVLLTFLGIIAVIIILWGGFKWMTAAGNEEKVAEGRSLIIAGMIGLVVILGAFVLTAFVVNALSNATGSTVTF